MADSCSLVFLIGMVFCAVIHLILGMSFQFKSSEKFLKALEKYAEEEKKRKKKLVAPSQDDTSDPNEWELS